MYVYSYLTQLFSTISRNPPHLHSFPTRRSSDLEIGFVSSNRSGNVDNIYRVAPVCSAVIHSIVRSEATNEPLSGAVVTLYDANENRLASKNTGADGKVEFTVECDNKFVLQAAKGEYETNKSE